MERQDDTFDVILPAIINNEGMSKINILKENRLKIHRLN